MRNRNRDPPLTLLRRLSSNAVNPVFETPASDNTFVIAAVNVVFP